jgi:hypothetical protein
MQSLQDYANLTKHGPEPGGLGHVWTVTQAYGVERTPEVFLFDKQGQLRYHGAIDDNYDNPGAVKDPYLRNALDAVLGTKPLALATTQPQGARLSGND